VPILERANLQRHASTQDWNKFVDTQQERSHDHTKLPKSSEKCVYYYFNVCLQDCWRALALSTKETYNAPFRWQPTSSKTYTTSTKLTFT
jgi:hypothetical protein